MDPFKIFPKVETALRPDCIKEKGVLLLHGGEDISPAIYGEKCNQYCYKHDISKRDQEEMDLIERAMKWEMPIIGICRGAQLLCAMDGGTLIQHVAGHNTGSHELTDTRTGEIYISNSCHHQVMQPNKYNEVIAVNKRTVDAYDEESQRFDLDETPEIVYFPHLNAIGIQGHPEWLPNSAFQEYCTKLIQEFLLKE